MDSEVAEDTVVRPPAPARIDDPADWDADTAIRERRPFADIPDDALSEVSLPASPSTELESTLPLDYSFRVNTSAPVGLESAVVFGRNPALPRIVQGRPPLLIRVPSPRKEVSNTHLELRQHGALVIVTDLRTTNASIVTVPGRDPVVLRQGESLVVMPGTIIEIGDENTIEIMSATRTDQIEQETA